MNGCPQPLRFRDWMAIAAGFTFLTVLMTYPVAPRIFTRFMGDGHDGFTNTWNFWWVVKAISEGRNPYYTDFLYHPTGTTLLFHTLDPLNAIVAAPLRFVLPSEASYNVIALGTFVASGVCMFGLVRHLVGHFGAALVAGIAFAFCPYRMGHSLGHINLMSTYWIPLYVLALLKLLESPGLTRAALAAFVLFLCWFSSMYYVLFLLPFSIVYCAVLRLHVGPDSRSRLQMIWLGASLFFLTAATSFVWIPMLVILSREAFVTNVHDPVRWSADLLSFFVPGELSSYGEMFRGVWSRFGGNTAEGSNYIGFTMLGLGGWAWIRCPRSRIWLVTGLVFLVLALGPRLIVAGNVLPIPLPYSVIHMLPFISMSGVPERFNVLFLFCMDIAAAYGIRLLCGKAGNNVRTSALVVLVLAEYLCVPFPTRGLQVSPFYRTIASDVEDFAILETPFSPAVMHLQTIHGKRLVNGYIARAPESALAFINQTPIINALTTESEFHMGEKQRRDALEVLQNYRIRYIVIRTKKLRAWIEHNLKLPIIFDGGGMRVYGPINRVL